MYKDYNIWSWAETLYDKLTVSGKSTTRNREGFMLFAYSHNSLNWGRRWDFRLFGFGHFLGRFFRFLQWKTSVFRFCCPLWFSVFPFFTIWFSVFWQKQRGFSDFGDRCGFRFFQFGRSSKTNLHGLPVWLLWLCRIINCLQVTILLLQACLFWYDRRSQKLFSAEADFLF